MAKFAIKVAEVLAKTVIVEAEDLDEAISKVETAVEEGEIDLSYDDYCDREIEPSNRWHNGLVPANADVSIYQHLDEWED